MTNTPPPLPQPPPRKGCRSNAWIALLIVLAILGSVYLVSRQFARSLTLPKKLIPRSAAHNHAVDEFPDLTEVWSYGDGSVKVARITVSGVILRDMERGVFSSPFNMVDSVLAQIRTAQADSDVKAILLEVDSPGGAVTPSDEIYRALKTFQESEEDRIIVVFMRDLAASGGYYIAMSGSWLIAEPTTVVGSIGVLLQAYNIKGLSEKLGITDVTIKSGANKDMLNPFQDVDPAQRAIMQGMIDSMYERFLRIVADGRNIPVEELRPLADGRIFDADQALELNLVDQIGYWDDAVAKTAELLDVDSVKVVRYDQPTDFMRWLMSISSPLQPSHWLSQFRSRFLFLWQP